MLGRLGRRETAVFTQRGDFQLITDRHIWKAPSFPHPMDLSIRRAHAARSPSALQAKVVRMRSRANTLDLLPDLIKGLVLPITTNLRPDTQEIKVSMVVATAAAARESRDLAEGEEPFSLIGSHRKALRFLLKIEQGAAGDAELDPARDSADRRERRRPTL
jgi:hypothetical protein